MWLAALRKGRLQQVYASMWLTAWGWDAEGDKEPFKNGRARGKAGAVG